MRNSERQTTTLAHPLIVSLYGPKHKYTPDNHLIKTTPNPLTRNYVSWIALTWGRVGHRRHWLQQGEKWRAIQSTHTHTHTHFLPPFFRPVLALSILGRAWAAGLINWPFHVVGVHRVSGFVGISFLVCPWLRVLACARVHCLSREVPPRAAVKSLWKRVMGAHFPHEWAEMQILGRKLPSKGDFGLIEQEIYIRDCVKQSEVKVLFSSLHSV